MNAGRVLIVVLILGLCAASGSQAQTVASPSPEETFLGAMNNRVRNLSYEYVDGVHAYAGENYNDGGDSITRTVGRMVCWNDPHAGEPVVININTRTRDAFLYRLPDGELHVVRIIQRERENARTGRRETYNSLEFVPEDYCLVIAESDAALRHLLEQARDQPRSPRLSGVPTATLRCTSGWRSNIYRSECYSGGNLIHRTVCTVGVSGAVSCTYTTY